MRRLAILVCLTALALMMPGLSSAQTTVYDYDDGAAWWNAYGCPEMMVLLPKLFTTAEETDANHKKRVCVPYAQLPNLDKVVIDAFVATTDTDAHATNEAWWDANDMVGDSANNVNRQILAGAVPIVATSSDDTARYGAQTSTAAETGAGTLYSVDYDELTRQAKTVVDKAGNALSGRAMMTTEEEEEEEAPALPLVGVGLLGLLLAGRGAWLRRRA